MFNLVILLFGEVILYIWARGVPPRRLPFHWAPSAGPLGQSREPILFAREDIRYVSCYMSNALG
jgi:hypothetical protein